MEARRRSDRYAPTLLLKQKPDDYRYVELRSRPAAICDYYFAMHRFIDNPGWTWTLIRVALIVGPVLAAGTAIYSMLKI